MYVSGHANGVTVCGTLKCFHFLHPPTYYCLTLRLKWPYYDVFLLLVIHYRRLRLVKCGTFWLSYKLIEQYNPYQYVPNTVVPITKRSSVKVLLWTIQILLSTWTLYGWLRVSDWIIHVFSSAYLRNERVHRFKYLTYYEVIHNYLIKLLN